MQPLKYIKTGRFRTLHALHGFELGIYLQVALPRHKRSSSHASDRYKCRECLILHGCSQPWYACHIYQFQLTWWHGHIMLVAQIDQMLFYVNGTPLSGQPQIGNQVTQERSSQQRPWWSFHEWLLLECHQKTADEIEVLLQILRRFLIPWLPKWSRDEFYLNR